MVEISPNRHMPDIKIDNRPPDVLPGNASERAEIHLKELMELQSTPGIKIGHIEVMPEITDTTTTPKTNESQITDDEISGSTQTDWESQRRLNQKLSAIRSKINPQDLLSKPPFVKSPDQIDKMHIKDLQKGANATGRPTTYTTHDGRVIQIKPTR